MRPDVVALRNALDATYMTKYPPLKARPAKRKKRSTR